MDFALLLVTGQPRDTLHGAQSSEAENLLELINRARAGHVSGHAQARQRAELTRERVDGSMPRLDDRPTPLAGLVGAKNRGRKAYQGQIWRPLHGGGGALHGTSKRTTLSSTGSNAMV